MIQDKRIVTFVVVLGLLVSSCSGSDASRSEGTESSAYQGSQDPQIFSDVVAGVYTTSSNHARSVRFSNATLNIRTEACGGEASEDLSSTVDRFNQRRYADLELIAEKGLVERSDSEPSTGYTDVDVLENCEQDVLPSLEEYQELAVGWSDATSTAAESDAVSGVEPEVASCLASESGLEVDATDPTSSYLSEVDFNLSGTDADWETEMLRFSKVYASCTGPYFEAIEAELQVEQDELVERNRELLEQFTQEISDAGYVP